MWGYDGFCCGFGWWWIFPIFMIIMVVLCFLMMRGRRRFMMCGPSSRTAGDPVWKGQSESASEILDKRYARGEIGKEEYEEKKRDIVRTAG
jgi:putative membrane protein